jgi:hypothetical protein
MAKIKMENTNIEQIAKSAIVSLGYSIGGEAKMKICRQCQKERNENEFRTVGKSTYSYCTYCETLNKKFTYLHKHNRTEEPEYKRLYNLMVELERRGGILIKQVDRIINNKPEYIETLIKEVL